MLDFEKLRTDPTAQRSPFEGLICGIARRDCPEDGSSFTWIDGSGGDGGLEAYWTTTSGTEIGYQAKYHRASRDINWTKIDDSVRAALRSHPRLERYVVATACNLTGEIPGRKGTPGQTHWVEHVKRWKELSESLGMKVSFEFWGASEIEDRLTKPKCVGLRSYWLQELELSQDWIKASFETARRRLDERYHPEDHVEVTAAAAFSGLFRDERLRCQISLQTAEFETLDRRTRISVDADVEAALSKLWLAIDATRTALESVLPQDVIAASNVARAKDCFTYASTQFDTVFDLIREHLRAAKNKPDSIAASVMDRYLKAQTFIQVTSEIVSNCERFLQSSAFQADEKRFVLAFGRAGSGKSHLLAFEVEKLVEQGVPAVLLVGSQFSDREALDKQIPDIVGVKASFENFLDTLNAAAEAIGARGLIAVDAINEGGGRRWREELGALAISIARRPWLAFAVTCRSEYVSYLITDTTRTQATVIEIEGFTTEAEQEAASGIYLDRRGILRPATPWLSPEFTNPLFLRTTANALRSLGRNEYPTGLNGTKVVLKFYLDTAARNLGTAYDGSSDLVRPITGVVKELARVMAKARRDYVFMEEAREIAAQEFNGFTAPNGLSWLDILQRNGVVRPDAQTENSGVDPLDCSEDIIRFGFQRFQDYLCAESLLAETPLVAADFKEGGRLSFVIERNEGFLPLIAYEWRSVVQALWIAHAEKHKLELYDILPDDIVGLLQSDFIETIYWRSKDAFTERTLELFIDWIVKKNDFLPSEHIRVLLRVGLQDHPWNADFLNEILMQQNMPVRDAMWTLPVAYLGRYDPDHTEAHTLARWTNGSGVQHAHEDILKRALIVLGWLFTTTDQALRDKATKGATAILQKHPHLLPDFVRHFADVDDAYVRERVAAACAGACLRDPSAERLRIAAPAIYATFFENGAVTCLLTRDYARSIVELANDHGVLSTAIDLQRCRPPFGSDRPKWPSDQDSLKKRADEIGGRAILSSCLSGEGDFGRYVIRSRIDNFSAIPISSSPLKPSPDADWSEVSQLMEGSKQDIEKACLWVAERSFDLGWTKMLFPSDSTIRQDQHAGKIERVGKKYQWIALRELLARLADNFWLKDEYRTELFFLYDNPNDVPFVRDIEITTPPMDTFDAEDSEANLPVLVVGDVEEGEPAGKWVFEDGLASSHLSLTGLGETGDDWQFLYRDEVQRKSWPDGHKFMRRFATRQEEFFYQMMVGLPSTEVERKTQNWKTTQVDFHHWLPESRTDRGYLYELDKRNTWDYGRLGPENRLWDKNAGFLQFTIRYHWESHLDQTMPHGLELQIPSPWLLQALRLRADPVQVGVFRDSSGRAVVISQRRKGGVFCLIRKRDLMAALASESVEPVWVGFGERSYYPHQDSKTECLRRRWNGVYVPSKPSHKLQEWNKDYGKRD